MQSALLKPAASHFSQAPPTAYRPTHNSELDSRSYGNPPIPQYSGDVEEAIDDESHMDLPYANEAYYSNSDIQILHEIVKAAESLIETHPLSESIPTSVLFRAYDEILPNHGFDPDEDQHFSRVLFRIGGERGPESLIRKFEAVLDRMGIQIIFDDATGAITTEYPLLARRHSLATVPEEQTQQMLEAEADDDSYEKQSNQTSASPPPPPEISHSSPDITEPRLDKVFTTANPRPITRTAAWLEEARRQMRELGIDDETEAVTQDQTTTHEPLPAAPLQRESAPSPETLNLGPQDDAESVEDIEQSSESSDNDGSEDDDDEEEYEPTQPMNLVNTRARQAQRPVTPESPSPQRPPASRNLHKKPSPIPSRDSTITRGHIPVFEHVAEKIAPNPPSPTQTTQPSQVIRRLEVDFEEMEARSQLAQDYQTLAEATRIFRWWRDRSKVYPATEEYNDAVAMTEQRRIAIQTTLVQWKDEAEYLRKQRIEKEIAAQKQREYMKIERIATRAGQIYSLTNNFALWRVHASEESERIGLARRHLMRKRYFDQWTQLTISYHKLAQQFIQTINFERWAEAAAYLSRTDYKTEQLSSRRVVKLTLRDWKREGRELLAERTRDVLVCERITKAWEQATETSLQRQKKLEELSNLAITRNAFGSWQNWSSDKDLQWEHGACEAAVFHAGNTFQVWKGFYSEVELQHKYENVLSENCLRQWNLQGKTMWLQGKFNQKLRNTAFRDWLLLQRMVEFCKQREEKQRQQIFGSWFESSSLQRDMDTEEYSIEVARQISSTHVEQHIQRWNSAAAKLARSDYRVERKEATTSVANCLEVWKEAGDLQPAMTRWSKRGEFFLVANCRLVPWISRSREIRKKRLAAAFTKGRAIQKESLVHQCWGLWEDSLALSEQKARRLETAHRKHDRHNLAAILRDWKADCADLDYMDQSTELDSEERHLESVLVLWLEQANMAVTADNVAWDLSADQVANEAWKQWRMATMTVDFKESNASSLGQQRIMALRDKLFATWVDTNNAIRSPDVEILPEPPVWSRTPAAKVAVNFSNLARMSTMSQPSIFINSKSNSDFTDLMANTPSRPASLARSLAALSSTPKIALSTPKERELRAVYDGRTQFGQPSTPARNPLSQSAGPSLGPGAQRSLRLALFQSQRKTRPLSDLDEESTVLDEEL